MEGKAGQSMSAFSMGCQGSGNIFSTEGGDCFHPSQIPMLGTVKMVDNIVCWN